MKYNWKKIIEEKPNKIGFDMKVKTRKGRYYTAWFTFRDRFLRETKTDIIVIHDVKYWSEIQK